MSQKDERDELRRSLPPRLPDEIRARRGTYDAGLEEELPVAATVHHTGGAEVSLDLQVSADWSDSDRARIGAYLEPLQAVQLGEKLIAAGRAALDELAKGLS